MGDAEYYREQAEFCVHMSNVMPSPEEKERWLQLAQQWREMADLADRGSANSAGR
jgi:hypothetical protein